MTTLPPRNVGNESLAKDQLGQRPSRRYRTTVDPRRRAALAADRNQLRRHARRGRLLRRQRRHAARDQRQPDRQRGRAASCGHSSRPSTLARSTGCARTIRRSGIRRRRRRRHGTLRATTSSMARSAPIRTRRPMKCCSSRHAPRRPGDLCLRRQQPRPAAPDVAHQQHDGRGYGSLGQTWSMPRVARVKGHIDPVLIMGGGYDPAPKMSVPAGTPTIGRGVYVMNMRTGARLGWLPTDYSVPADVTIVDSDGDGYVDRVYVVDVRAQLYRIDIEDAPAAPSRLSVAITKIAALNDGTGGTDGTRKVFFAPDFGDHAQLHRASVRHRRSRETAADTTNDRFFLIKDTRVAKGEPTSVSLITEADFADVGNAPVRDRRGLRLCARDQWRKGYQPADYVWRHHLLLDQSAAAAGAAAVASRSQSAPTRCRWCAGSDRPKSDRRRPSALAGVGYVDVGRGKLVPFVIGGGDDKNSAIEASARASRFLLSESVRSGSWRTATARVRARQECDASSQRLTTRLGSLNCCRSGAFAAASVICPPSPQEPLESGVDCTSCQRSVRQAFGGRGFSLACGLQAFRNRRQGSVAAAWNGRGRSGRSPRQLDAGGSEAACSGRWQPRGAHRRAGHLADGSVAGC